MLIKTDNSFSLNRYCDDVMMTSFHWRYFMTHRSLEVNPRCLHLAKPFRESSDDLYLFFDIFHDSFIMSCDDVSTDSHDVIIGLFPFKNDSWHQQIPFTFFLDLVQSAQCHLVRWWRHQKWLRITWPLDDLWWRHSTLFVLNCDTRYFFHFQVFTHYDSFIITVTFQWVIRSD